MYFVDRSAVVVKPTAAFLQWLNSVEDDDLDLTLAQLRSDCTVLLVPECETPEQVIAYVGERYEAIFQAELSAWYADPKLWPQDMSLSAFWTFFEVDVHDMVLDMEAGDMQLAPVLDNMM